MNQFGSYILLGLAMFIVSAMMVVFELSRPTMTFVVSGCVQTDATLLHVASVCTSCCMLLLVVAQSLKPVKLFSQQLPAFLLFRDRRSVAQQCWIRLHSSSNTYFIYLTSLPTLLGPHTLITHGLQRLTGCILPTMHCRSQQCWELLHPFAHHCQHGRNNSQHCWRNNVGSCCVRLHTALGCLHTIPDSFSYGHKKLSGKV